MIAVVIPARALIAFAFALQSLVGLRLDDAISLLQRQGLTIIYSSALVRPEMRVEREPRAAGARGKLEEILAPHGLAIAEGPHGELLVIAGPKPVPQATPPRPAPKPHFSEEIDVSPQRAASNDSPSEHATISSDDIRRMPDPSTDLTRAVQRMPGIASSDAAATVNIRGAAADEAVIAIDGLELNEPFHLKDFFSIFSTLDTAAVSRVDMMTGAFPAEWGDRVGGVIDIDLLTPPAEQSTSISAGMLNSRLTSSGTSRDRNTNWLISARGWYPDIIFSADKDPSEVISTDCYDLIGKAEHRLTGRTTASLTFLGSYDNLGYRNQTANETARSNAEERSVHLWLTTKTDWSETASVRSILAAGRLWRDRAGSITGNGPLQIRDLRGYDFVELKQDWRAGQLKFGFDAKSSRAHYDYTRMESGIAPVDTHLRANEETFALYAAEQFHLGSAVAEAGLRWDHQSLRGESQVSPRINLLWPIGTNSDLRLGWGHYYQSQRLNELQVEDGVTQFAAPELEEQRTVSFEHRFAGGYTLQASMFDKPMSHVRARFENTLNPINVFPEAQDDRAMVAPSRSRASGIELRMTGHAGARFDWWTSYVHSRATDTIDGRSVPRSWDQPNAASAGLNAELPGGWTATVSGAYHTGWPTTPVRAVMTPSGVELVRGDRNSERLPAWFRIDGGVTKAIHTARGELLIALDIINMTNHDNVCCIHDVSPVLREDGSWSVTREDRSLIPFFPSLSARWKF